MLPRQVPASAAGLTGADVIRIIRARMLLIILLSIVFFAIGTGITLIFYIWYPSYTATAYIRVQSINPINVMNPLERTRVEAEEVQRLLQDQALLVKSPQVLLAALEDNELRATKWFAEAQEKEKNKGDDPQDLLLDILQAAPVRDSNFVGVSAIWKVPKEVPTIVNTIVLKYVDLINKLQKQSIRDTEVSMNKELNTAKNLYDGKQREIEEFRSSEEILSKPGGEKEQEVAVYQALVTELTVDLDGKRAIWDALEKTRPEDLPITPDLKYALETDPQIYQADQKLQEEDERLAAAQARYGDNHRLVKESKLRREQFAIRAEQERASKILKYQTEQIEQARRSFL